MEEPKIKVLVVDDDNISRRLLCKILQNCNFEPLAAEDSKAALQILATDKEIDIVISDIMMPGDDGFEFKRQLEENPLYNDKKVLFCSSLRDPETIIKAKNLKTSGYLLKPFQEKYIKDTLDKIIPTLSPTLEVKSTICKNLNMDEAAYGQKLSEFLQEISELTEKMKDLREEKYWSDIEQAMSSMHANTKRLGAFRLEAIVNESLLSLKNKQIEDIDDLIVKLEREGERIALYSQRRDGQQGEAQEVLDKGPDSPENPLTLNE